MKSVKDIDLNQYSDEEIKELLKMVKEEVTIRNHEDVNKGDLRLWHRLNDSLGYELDPKGISKDPEVRAKVEIIFRLEKSILGVCDYVLCNFVRGRWSVQNGEFSLYRPRQVPYGMLKKYNEMIDDLMEVIKKHSDKDVQGSVFNSFKIDIKKDEAVKNESEESLRHLSNDEASEYIKSLHLEMEPLAEDYVEPYYKKYEKLEE